MSDASTALIVVDVQNDFCPGGALGRRGRRPPRPGDRRGGGACRDGRRHARLAPGRSPLVRRAGGPWPPHCVQGTPGAELHPSVAGLPIDRVQDVGVRPDDEGYSGFEGNDLAAYLRGRGVRRVLVTGIATDYCVRATALDAVREGFETTVLTDAVVAIDVAAGDGRRALDEVRAAGGSLDRVALAPRRGRARADPRGQGRAHARGGRRPRAAGRLIIGLSGGIDSAVALGIAARAVGARRRDRRAAAVPAHRAGAPGRRRGDGGRRRPARREPAHGLDRADPGGPRRGAARRRRLGHPVRERQRAEPDDRDLRPRPGPARARARHREPHREPARLLHAVRRRRIRHRADHRPLQDRGARGRARARPAGGGHHEAPDRRPLGRPDRRGRARLHLRRRRPRAGGDLRPRHDARPRRPSGRASSADVVERVLARAAGVAWKHAVPHTL